MSSMIEIIRAVVRQELNRDRHSLLGVITAIFPHTEADDDNNYEANVSLKHEDLELTKVPLAVGHLGIAAPPQIGDLVLVQFINGDINQPVITGRFYHEDNRPPLHQADEILFEQRVNDNTINQLRFASDGTIYLQRDVTNLEDNSQAAASLKIDVSGSIEIKVGENNSITLADDNVDVNCTRMTVNGELVITNNANSTTINGNEISGR